MVGLMVAPTSLSLTSETAIATVEEAIVTIVREATLPTTQDRFVAQAGVRVERAGYCVLRGVAELGHVRVTELAHHLGVDVSTVSRQVRTLERQGLIARAGDPTDGRVARLALTSAGTEALHRLREVRHRFFSEVLDRWPTEDRETLAPLLARLAHDFLVQGGRL